MQPPAAHGPPRRGARKGHSSHPAHTQAVRNAILKLLVVVTLLVFFAPPLAWLATPMRMRAAVSGLSAIHHLPMPQLTHKRNKNSPSSRASFALKIRHPRALHTTRHSALLLLFCCSPPAPLLATPQHASSRASSLFGVMRRAALLIIILSSLSFFLVLITTLVILTARVAFFLLSKKYQRIMHGRARNRHGPTWRLHSDRPKSGASSGPRVRRHADDVALHLLGADLL